MRCLRCRNRLEPYGDGFRARLRVHRHPAKANLSLLTAGPKPYQSESVMNPE